MENRYVWKRKKLLAERTIKTKYLIEIITVRKKTVRFNNLSKSVRNLNYLMPTLPKNTKVKDECFSQSSNIFRRDASARKSCVLATRCGISGLKSGNLYFDVFTQNERGVWTDHFKTRIFYDENSAKGLEANLTGRREWVS